MTMKQSEEVYDEKDMLIYMKPNNLVMGRVDDGSSYCIIQATKQYTIHYNRVLESLHLVGRSSSFW